MNVLVFLLVGVIAGWLAGGLLMHLLAGIIGALIGGLGLVGLGPSLGAPLLDSVIRAAIGAGLAVLVLRLIKRP